MLVEISDGRRGVLDLKTNTIRTLQIMNEDLPPVTYYLDDKLLESQKIRTVGGELSWKYCEPRESSEPKQTSKIEVDDIVKATDGLYYRVMKVEPELSLVRILSGSGFSHPLSIDDLEVIPRSEWSKHGIKLENVVLIGDVVYSKDNAFKVRQVNTQSVQPILVSLISGLNVSVSPTWDFMEAQKFDMEALAIFRDKEALKEYYPNDWNTENYITAEDLDLKPPKRSNTKCTAKVESQVERTSIEELRKISTENRLEAKLDDLYASLNIQARKGHFRLNVDSSEFNDCIPYLKSQGFKILEHGTLIEIDWSLRG